MTPTRVVLPDGSALNYAYDDAHRLTALSNDAGELIEYKLAAARGSDLAVLAELVPAAETGFVEVLCADADRTH